MAHQFVVLIGNTLHEFDKYEDIPDSFDNVIKFIPEIPDGPHTHDQHDEIDTWNDKLAELLKRERK